VRQREGFFYLCAHCQGRALTIPQVRRVAGDRQAARMLRLIGLSREQASYACPFCGERMVNIRLAEPALQLQACRPCSAVWFDAPSYESLPEAVGSSTNALLLLSTEIFAKNKLQELKERQKRDQAEKKKKGREKGVRDL